MSKRQDTLFKRMKSAQKRFYHLRVSLDRTLLNELHKNGVYTTNQFHKVYVKKADVNNQNDNQ